MTIQDCLTSQPNTETDLILEHVMKKPKEFLYTHPEKKLTVKQIKTFKTLVARRKKHEPIAYILGCKYFYGLKFKVTKHTLIPRPETEWVIEHILHTVNSKQLTVNSILDIGTGSGCIAICLKKQLPKLKVTASDTSKQALLVAKQNAKTHKTKINFSQSNLLSDLKNQHFDVIIANLPYGWATWNNTTPKNNLSLKFEPQLALITKEHGLFLYKKLLEQISMRESRPKKVYLEFDPRQKSTLSKLIIKKLPKAKLKFYKDLAKLWRYVEISL